MRSERFNRSRFNSYDELLAFWREKVKDDALERYLYSQAKATTSQNKGSERVDFVGEATQPDQGKGKGKGKGARPKDSGSAEPQFKARIQ